MVLSGGQFCSREGGWQCLETFWLAHVGGATDTGQIEARNAAHTTVHRPVPDGEESGGSKCQ